MEFCKCFLTWWSKMFCLCPEDIFEEIIFFFTKSSNFSVVVRLWGIISDFWRIHSSWVVKTVFKCAGDIFERVFFKKTSSLNCLFNFGLRAQFVRTFGEKFSICLSKLHSMCPEEIFDWTVFSTIFFEFFHSLRAVRKLFWLFGKKASKKLSQLQFMCTKSFCWKFDFRKNFHTFFENWSKILLTFVRKCWAREKFWVRLSFSSEKIHVFLWEVEEEGFGVR